MVDLSLPPSTPLESLSPTAFEAIRLCALRGAFRQQHPGARVTRTPQQVLGDLCHAVLEELVSTGAIRGESWAQAVDPAWRRLAARMAEEVHAEPHEASLSGTPEQWPGYVIKRARLKKAAGRLRGLLATAARDAELISEAPLVSADGQLQGRPDLIVRAATDTWVIDYKSGAVIDEEARAPRASYVRQLHFYALLEQASSGRWPTRGFLLPLSGPLVEVPIDPVAAAELGDQARLARERFNSAAPSAQPASPSQAACRSCVSATRCRAFWQTCGSWQDAPTAAAGVVRSVVRTAIGGVSLTLDVQTGTVEAKKIVVRNVSLAEHPDAARIAEGDEVALVNLRKVHRSEELALPAWGSLAIWAPAA